MAGSNSTIHILNKDLHRGSGDSHPYFESPVPPSISEPQETDRNRVFTPGEEPNDLQTDKAVQASRHPVDSANPRDEGQGRAPGDATDAAPPKVRLRF